MQFTLSILATVLWMSVATAEISLSDNDPEATTAALLQPSPLSVRTSTESTYDAVSYESEAAPLANAAVQTDRDLSTFGIMALGLVGLVWVRRHASGT